MSADPEQAELDALLEQQSSDFRKEEKKARKKETDAKKTRKQKKAEKLEWEKNFRAQFSTSSSAIEKDIASCCEDDFLRECLIEDLRTDAKERGLSPEYARVQFVAFSKRDE
jgi:hypothetical protein